MLRWGHDRREDVAAAIGQSVGDHGWDRIDIAEYIEVSDWLVECR